MSASKNKHITQIKQMFNSGGFGRRLLLQLARGQSNAEVARSKIQAAMCLTEALRANDARLVRIENLFRSGGKGHQVLRLVLQGKLDVNDAYILIRGSIGLIEEGK